MKTNKILAKMREGQKAYGCSLNFSSATVIELLGQADLDYVFLDGEHGPFTPETIEEMCRAADLAGLTPIAPARIRSSPGWAAASSISSSCIGTDRSNLCTRTAFMASLSG